MNETFSLSNHSDSDFELSNKESESENELLNELGNECEIFQECNN